MYKKRMIVFLLVFAMILGITPAAGAVSKSEAEAALDALEQGFAEMYGDSEETRIAAEFINYYRNDEMFETYYEYDSEGALGMVNAAVNGAIRQLHEPEPQWTDGQIYGAEGVPTYKQVNTSSCGTASALQVIIQQGCAGNIPGNTYNEKEQTLINEVGTSIAVGQIAYLINKYVGVENKFICVPCNAMNMSEFSRLVLGSLAKDCPVVLHTIKKFVDYYPSTDNGGHYIVGTHYFALTGQFAVNDCHYSDTYNGIHYISMQNAYDSVHSPFQGARYLIYAP